MSVCIVVFPVVSFVKPAADVLCTGANCHTWMEEKSQWETTIRGGCGVRI